MVGTSGGGFALMVEGLGLSGIAELPVVIADIQRPGPATGLPTRSEQSDLLFTCFASQGEFPRMVIAVRGPCGCVLPNSPEHSSWRQSIRFLCSCSATSIWRIPQLRLRRWMRKKPAKLVTPLTDDAVEDAAYNRYTVTDSGISPMRVPGKTEALVRVDSDEHFENGTITRVPLYVCRW